MDASLDLKELMADVVELFFLAPGDLSSGFNDEVVLICRAFCASCLSLSEIDLRWPPSANGLIESLVLVLGVNGRSDQASA